MLVRLAKCCTPVPGDPIVGYISLGKGITIHREDCPNVKALRRNEERFTPVEWDGDGDEVVPRPDRGHSWDRPRLLEDVARTFAEHGANIVSYGGVVEDQLAKNWYTAEVGDVKSLRSLLNSLRAARLGLRRLPRDAVIAQAGGHSIRTRTRSLGRRAVRARAARLSRTRRSTCARGAARPRDRGASSSTSRPAPAS